MAELSLRRTYAIVLGSRIRSQYAYRTSFWLTVATSLAIGGVEFIEIYAILHNVPVFGGLDFRQAALVFALSNIAFALADLVFGQLDSMPSNIRMGRLEVMLVRPMPLLAQLVTADFQLRRLGRVAVGVIIATIALPGLDVAWSPSVVYLLIITPLAGAAIFGAFFTIAGGLQFFVIDGAELTNSFVYGGAYAAQIPGSVLITPIRVLFTFVFPATLVAYLPTLLVLGLPGAMFLPSWLGWFAPVFAVWIWVVAAVVWRIGLRRFVGAGDEMSEIATGEPIVEFTDLRRSFVIRAKAGRLRREKRVVHAVDGITTTIAAGEAVGYIGANGAGKSTTIKMITGVLVPSSGRVRTCGLDPVPQRRQLARHVGVVFGQRSQLWWDLPLRDSFRILAAIHRIPTGTARPRVDELVAELELDHLLDTPVRQLSLGERMRGEVAAALVHRPRLLVLDEPTIGLDVLSKERLRRFLVAERARENMTLLLTTHDMSDIERLCDRVLVVDHGRLAYDGTLPELAQRVALRRVLVVDLMEPHPPLRVDGAEHLGSEADGLRQRFAFAPEETTAARVLAAVSAQVEIRDLTLDEPAIEDIVSTLYRA